MRRAILWVFLVLMAPICANGQVILGNLPQANDNSQTAGITDLRQKAFRFTMPGTGAIAGDLTLRLRNYDTANEAIAEIRDFSGSNTAPGANTLMTFDAPLPGGAAIDNYIFQPGSSLSLAANTTYWLVVRGIVGGTFDWMASSPSITPTGLATFGSSSFTTNAGSTWSNSTILTSFEFNAVPEPMFGTSLMVAILAALGLRRRT